MTRKQKLLSIKIVHTLIWVFFNVVIFYLLYAVLINKIDKWVWIGLGLFGLEAIILVLFKMSCPLTVIARKYSSSAMDNFDIFLPNWLAKHNKFIYTVLLSAIILLLICRLFQNNPVNKLF